MTKRNFVQVIFYGRQNEKLNKKRIRSLIAKAASLPMDIDYSSQEGVPIQSFSYISDCCAFNLSCIDSDASYVIIVTKHQLQNNFFARENISHYETARNCDQIISIVTTFEADEICASEGLSLENYIVGAAILSIFSAKFVQAGGRYHDLWIDAEEESVFGFCRDKVEAIQKSRNPVVGDRARSLIRQSAISDESLEALEKDCKILQPKFSDRIRKFSKNNRDVIIAVISLAIGFVLGSL